MDKQTELLQKIKALAERGVDGEQENAKKILADLMIKYGITENDLSEEQTELEWFRFKNEYEKRLLNQIIYMILGKSDTYRRTNGKYKLVGVYCTTSQKIEIEFNFDFFNCAMKKEFTDFFEAFACKNNLFPPVSELQGKPPPEDEAHNMKIAFMAAGMERHTPHKALMESGAT